MQIDHAFVEAVKERVDLREVVEHTGVVLRQYGDDKATGLCPFHDDKNPSLSVYQKNGIWKYHCFGCKANGTVFDWVMQKEKKGFVDTYQWLWEKYGEQTPDIRRQTPDQRTEIKDQSKILDEVLKHYQSIFEKNQKAQEYLKSRGLTNPEIFEQFRIGYSDGSMPKQKELIGQLQDRGIVGEKGGEIFFDCVVFPIEDTDENLTGMYGRRVSEKAHRYLKGEHKGVFNARVFKAYQKIYLTEGIIDALSLYQVGIREAVALFGTNGLTDDHIKSMRDNLTREVVLCLDNDDAGKDAAKRIAEKLHRELGIKCRRVQLPDESKDMNEWLLKGMTRESVSENIHPIACGKQEQKEYVLTPIDDAVVRFDSRQEITFDFNHTLPERKYRVKQFDPRRAGNLKINLKVSTEEGMHLHTFDLYSHPAREQFKREAKKLLSLEERVTHQDLCAIIDSLEKAQEKHLAEKGKPEINGVPVMGPQEREDALALLKDPRLCERIVEDFHACGYIGEDMNLLTGYLVATSRKLSTPLGLYIIARSASGKSSLQDAVLAFMPEEEYFKYTRLTDQALFYQDATAMVHKLIAIEEERGARESDYGLRSLLTAKGITNAVPIKDPKDGKIRTMTYEVKGPTSQIITTTSSEIDYETYNRFIVTTVDESIEQTKNILIWQKKLRGKDKMKLHAARGALTRLHKNAQRLLRIVEVMNPYAEQLTFTDSVVVARREHMKYQNLIEAVTLLRQYQKPIKRDDAGNDYIETDLEDIKIANTIAAAVMAKGLSQMSPPTQQLLFLLKEFIRQESARLRMRAEEVLFSARQVREYTGWNHYQIVKHLAELISLEYAVITGCRGQGKRYGYKLMVDLHHDPESIDLRLSNLSDSRLQTQDTRPERENIANLQ